MSTLQQSSARAPELDAERFRKLGYTVAEPVFEPEEVSRLRGVATEVMAELEEQDLVDAGDGPEGRVRVTKCDLLSIERMRPVLLDERVIGVVSQLLGGQPTYFGDSSLRIGGSGGRAWHHDHIDRTKDRYTILRCGLYLQDHSHHSGGLGVRPYSNRIYTRFRRRTVPRLVSNGAGDLVAWDLRTMHLGETVRFRLAPPLALPVPVQNRLPDALRVPEQQERMAMFMTFGLDGAQLDNYVNYLKTRDYMQTTWSCSRFGPEVWEEARAAGLNVVAPTPEYGSPAGESTGVSGQSARG